MQEDERLMRGRGGAEMTAVGLVTLGRGVGIRDEELEKLWNLGGEKNRELVRQRIESDKGRQIKPAGLVETAVVKRPEAGLLGPEEHPAFDGEPESVNGREARYAG